MEEYRYYVYIISNVNQTVFYTGVTSNLWHRVLEHKTKVNNGFATKFNCTELLYFEQFEDVHMAIKREKQIKRYRREWKKNLINSQNSEWNDLAKEWYEDYELNIQTMEDPGTSFDSADNYGRDDIIERYNFSQA